MDKKSFGELFKVLREEKGLSQELLAKGICSRKAIFKYEKGISFPSIDIIFEFATKLGYEFIEKLSFSRHSNSVLLYKSFEELNILYENKRFDILHVKVNQILNEQNDISSYQRQKLLWYDGIYYGHIRKDYETSRTMFTDALSLTKDKTIPGCLDSFCTKQELHICNSYAVTFNFQRNFARSVKLFEALKKNMEYHQTINEDALFLKIYYNLAKCYIFLNNPTLALENCQKGIAYAQDRSIFRTLAELYLELGNCYILLEKPAKRDRAFKKFIYLYQINGKGHLVEEKKKEFETIYNIEFHEDLNY